MIPSKLHLSFRNKTNLSFVHRLNLISQTRKEKSEGTAMVSHTLSKHTLSTRSWAAIIDQSARGKETRHIDYLYVHQADHLLPLTNMTNIERSHSNDGAPQMQFSIYLPYVSQSIWRLARVYRFTPPPQRGAAGQTGLNFATIDTFRTSQGGRPMQGWLTASTRWTHRLSPQPPSRCTSPFGVGSKMCNKRPRPGCMP